ncbi:vancomycin resistance protein YoaR [Nocardioides sp. J9]|nr:vancomycin resistance protein YoaR [Nocardioides sp. J9]
MGMWDDVAKDADAKRERPGGRAVVVVVVVLLLLVGGGYAAAHAVAGDKVPPGTTISGVDVGGLTRAAAREKLEEAFGPRADDPIAITVEHRLPGEGNNGDRARARIKPADVGLAVDYDASLDEAGAEDSWSPGRQWDYFTGGDDLDAVVTLDEELFEERLTEAARGLGTPPKDGQVLFTADGVETVDPVPGEAIDAAAARDAITDAFLEGEDAVDLAVTTAQPEIGAEQVAEAVEDFAEPAMSGPVTLVFGENEVRLAPRRFARVLSMAPRDGELAPVVDEKKLLKLVEAATSDGKPVDATVRLVRNKPRVVPAKPGVEFDPADVVEVFTGLLTAAKGSRSGEVEAEVTEAEFTTKDARDLKIVEKVSEFSTTYPHADYRNVNIGRAAEIIDGTVLKPGETFSLNETVGERTVENGFTSGYIISNGILRKDLGGGVSQMATTLFNAMFFAGLKDIEHKPHSFYIDRYPVGREATVAWPTVDLRFQNDTDHGVLIHAWVEPSSYSRAGKVTVQMWSTKVWDIESTTSDRYGYTPPATRTLNTPDCEPHSGWSGFQVDVTRIFRKHGESAVDHTEKFHTVYTPSDTVVCKKPGPPPPEDPDEG